MHAQSWPTKPIRWVVPFAAGGSTDLSARVMAENLRPILGQPIVIDNRRRCGGHDRGRYRREGGARRLHVSRGIRDTGREHESLTRICLTTSSAILHPSRQMYFSTNVLVVNRKVPVSNLAEFIAYVKDGKNTVHYGTAGHRLVAASRRGVVQPDRRAETGCTCRTRRRPCDHGPSWAARSNTIFSPPSKRCPTSESGRLRSTARRVRLQALADRARYAADQRAPARLSLDIVERSSLAPVKTPPTSSTADESGAPEDAHGAGRPDALRRIGRGAGGQLPPAEYRKFVAAEAERLREQVRISGARLD